jgi:hypothetical protein
MDRRKDETNLAALLDSELQDSALIDALRQELEFDAALHNEFAAQQEVKQLLGSLDEYKAPDFMATRVLGEIAARRRTQALPRWRPIAAWLGGAAALVAGFGTSVSLMLPRIVQTGAPLLAENSAPASLPLDVLPVSDGFTSGMRYAPQVWDELPMPAGQVDSRVQNFLQFASEAHEYRRLLRSGSGNAGMADAVLVLDQNQAPLHWANDSN